MVDPYTASKGRPFQPILSTTVLCEIEQLDVPFVGFFYKDTEYSKEERNYLITARHNILPPKDYVENPECITLRLRSADDPRFLLNQHKIDLYEDGEPVWVDHYSNDEPIPEEDPYVDAVAIPIDIDIPAYSEGIIYNGETPLKYLKDGQSFGEDAIFRERLYVSAFTQENLPRGKLNTGDIIPFAGDSVSLISFQKTPDKNFSMPQIRQVMISTPYRMNYDEKPQFLVDSRTFSGSSGAPVLAIPPTRMYSHQTERRISIRKPCLLGVHLGMEHRDLANEQLNLCRELRANELLQIFKHQGTTI